VWKPEFYFLELLKERLMTHGIQIHGKLRIDTVYHGQRIAAISHRIDSVVHQINKPSDNLAAENLLKTLAVVKQRKPGASQDGLFIIKEYLTSVGIDTSKMILADGSGLSWYNAISPDAVVQLLFHEYHTPAFRRFYESLPIAGVDGTLKNRMKETRAEGNVHAKTGSLTGVSALSGYVKNRDGVTLIFSMLCNHFPQKILSLRNAQDNIMNILTSSSQRSP
jgi:D-alanyl-D-alanine carboxypeptidase/D-alanyl-D-alanine-endopeptidase (penicillin-binding protein 4)